MRALLPLLSLSLMACDPSSLIWPPLKEGPYVVELMAMTINECEFAEESVGIGALDAVELRWDNELVIFSNEVGEGTYLWNGETFEALGYQESALDDTCVFTGESFLVGEPFNRETFGLFDNMRVTWEGSCENWYIPANPCTVEFAWEGRYQGG
ncbi:MAG: hypothetical protein H6739_27185 [Alphaproteobacteria bacterium]|nr:hypothetical protein [Alphaproteobacteria bacterium]